MVEAINNMTFGDWYAIVTLLVIWAIAYLVGGCHPEKAPVGGGLCGKRRTD